MKTTKKTKTSEIMTINKARFMRKNEGKKQIKEEAAHPMLRGQVTSLVTFLAVSMAWGY